jgi:CheY-like chemotaxis protein
MGKVLVVDDHQDAAETTAELLRMSGAWEVRVAYNGLQAVQIARELLPQVVVLDINMPVMDGYEAATILRAEETSETRMLLIALTGRTGPDDLRKATEAGFDHHLCKPIDVRELCELVDSYFKGFEEEAGRIGAGRLRRSQVTGVLRTRSR